MPSYRDLIFLMRLNGATSSRDSRVLQLLGEGVASSCLARAPWSEATEIPPPPLYPQQANRGGEALCLIRFCS